MYFPQAIKKKKKAEGKLSEKDDMSQKEKEIFESQLMKEAEIRDRLKEVRISSVGLKAEYNTS